MVWRMQGSKDVIGSRRRRIVNCVLPGQWQHGIVTLGSKLELTFHYIIKKTFDSNLLEEKAQ
jgi:hypothetical protein